MMTKKDIKAIENCDYVIGDGWEMDVKVEVVGDKIQLTTINGTVEKYDFIENNNGSIIIESKYGDILELS